MLELTASAFNSWHSREEIQMKQKWYMQTWFICLLCAGWVFIIPAIVGIVLLVMQILDNKKNLEKYGTIDKLEDLIIGLEKDFELKKTKYNTESKRILNELMEKERKANRDFKISMEGMSHEEKETRLKIESLKREEELLTEGLIIEHYRFSDYDGLSSEECKNKLIILKNEEQDLIKSNEFVNISSNGSKQEINNNIKQIVRCLNSECDNILMNISVKNIDSMRKKVTRAFESLNKIFIVDGMQLTKKILEYKLEELNLVYTYELKREQEREQQKAIKEQMIEEEKVRREIERQKAKIEKDQLQCSNEVNKLLSYLQKAQSDVERNLYVDKIAELESKLKQLEEEKDIVYDREANALAGFVYIISNLGSFGENVYKIGMTRRLEPMDRIKELSSASVPFEFDVHAMIFSDNAPNLENALHKCLEKKSVNLVNLRKEFFRVSIDEIEQVVKENYNNTVEFIRVPVATEYRQTQSLMEKKA